MPIKIETTKGEEVKPSKSHGSVLAKSLGVDFLHAREVVTRNMLYGLVDLLIEKGVLEKSEILELLEKKRKRVSQIIDDGSEMAQDTLPLIDEHFDQLREWFS